MNIDINIISNPYVISADKAKELAKQHEETQLETDKKVVLECMRTVPWIAIQQKAKNGETSYSFTIGFDKGNICYVREKYGWAWLQENGAQFITDLFTSVGYKVEIVRFACYIRFYITWAD